MRLGYTHEKDNSHASKYWTNTILPLVKSGHFEAAVKNQYVYPNRIGLYPGLNCQFFCNFCGRNYNAKYNTKFAAQSLEVFQRVIDEDPRDSQNWKDRFRISGGLEPLTNPNIGEIINYGFQNGFNMQMYTNGYALSENFLNKQLGIFKLEVMRVSLYGHDEHSYTQVTKMPRSYQTVKENIRKFLQIKQNTKVGVNWILLPGHGNDLYALFDLIEDINSTQKEKIQFVTLREDFSQNASYLSNSERTELYEIFKNIEKKCSDSSDLQHLHIDYGYQLDPVRKGEPDGPLKMSLYNQMNKWGFPQIATALDSKGDLYVYHETGFIDRPGADRYIIGNIHDTTVEKIVKKHLSGKGIVAKPFDVNFLDAFDHLITLLLYQTNGKDNWLEILENTWK